jgi:hypothetical protein
MPTSTSSSTWSKTTFPIFIIVFYEEVLLIRPALEPHVKELTQAFLQC